MVRSTLTLNQRQGVATHPTLLNKYVGADNSHNLSYTRLQYTSIDFVRQCEILMEYSENAKD